MTHLVFQNIGVRNTQLFRTWSKVYVSQFNRWSRCHVEVREMIKGEQYYTDSAGLMMKIIVDDSQSDMDKAISKLNETSLGENISELDEEVPFTKINLIAPPNGETTETIHNWYKGLMDPVEFPEGTILNKIGPNIDNNFYGVSEDCYIWEGAPVLDNKSECIHEGEIVSLSKSAFVFENSGLCYVQIRKYFMDHPKIFGLWFIPMARNKDGVIEDVALYEYFYMKREYFD